jgi:uncharacterized cupredoxin-like copper-binding protein
MMNTGRLVATATVVALMFGSMVASGPLTRAQDATPTAAEDATPARPAHIHFGNCNELGEIAQPLTDLTAPTGAQGGQARRAASAQSSYTSVPMTLDAILDGDHAINVHMSAEDIGTYIACGEVGGNLTDNGALILGLREQSNSGYTGIAYMAPGADGASTDVSVFIAATNEGGRARQRAEGTPMAVEPSEGETPEAAEISDGTAGETAGTPEAEAATDDMTGMDMGGTPEATGEMDEADQAAGGEQVAVSLMEFAIDMPATVPAGPVTFAVTNNGTITHSFEVEGNGIEEELASPLSPGQTEELTVELVPGTYEIYCPIGNHADLGMRLQLTVE